MNTIQNYNLTPRNGELVLRELDYSKLECIKALLIIVVGIPLIFLFGLGLILVGVGVYYLIKTLDSADHNKYTITNKRVHTISGGENHRVALETDISDILSLEIVQDPLRKILGIGEIRVESKNGSFIFGPIENPEKVVDLINEQKVRV